MTHTTLLRICPHDKRLRENGRGWTEVYLLCSREASAPDMMNATSKYTGDIMDIVCTNTNVYETACKLGSYLSSRLKKKIVASPVLTFGVAVQKYEN